MFVRFFCFAESGQRRYSADVYVALFSTMKAVKQVEKRFEKSIVSFKVALLYVGDRTKCRPLCPDYNVS